MNVGKFQNCLRGLHKRSPQVKIETDCKRPLSHHRATLTTESFLFLSFQDEAFRSGPVVFLNDVDYYNGVI